MNHGAIDLGGKESQICIRRPDGTIVEERKHPTKKLPQLMASWPTSRIVMETCAEAFHLADAAKAAGHEVRIVPATLVRMFGVGARGTKNDQRDAQQLSAASCRIELPSVHIPSAQARELKSACGSRDALIASRTKLINNVRGWMRTQVWRMRSGRTSTFADRLRGHAAALGAALPEHIERQLRVLDALEIEIRLADKQLSALANNNPVCRRLMTVPGVGPITALRFFATIDDPKRFASAHRVESYLGLTPGEHSSSERVQKTGINKAGAPALRVCLVQCAWHALRTTQPMADWARQIADRRGRHIAVVALARKIAGILFAIWRDSTTYRPHQNAAALPN